VAPQGFPLRGLKLFFQKARLRKTKAGRAFEGFVAAGPMARKRARRLPGSGVSPIVGGR